MNYYERHLGDYSKDTAHLTMIEHGAYGLLLDRYYGTEQGIPADQAHRIARARTKEEKAAVDIILAEFFQLIDGLWINKRAKEEIAKSQSKINAAKENGKKGGRPKKDKLDSGNEAQQKPNWLFMGSENETKQKAHQTPDTNHQSPYPSGTTHTIPSSNEVQPSIAGAVCVAIRSEGIVSTNPSNLDLQALIESGAEIQDFVNAARIAKERGKGFGYVLGIVKTQRSDAERNKLTGKGNIHEQRAYTIAELTGANRIKTNGGEIDGYAIKVD